MSRAALWHDVECGAYGADLGLWIEFAAEAGGPVLELGCGTGRVALELAQRGAGVTGVDRDRELIAALRARAAERGLDVEGVVADVRTHRPGREFALAIAPMQLVHLLGGPAGRRAMLRRVGESLAAGGRFALALLSEEPADEPGTREPAGAPRPLPDVREHEGWVYSSLPVAIERENGALAVRRLRQAVSPGGELDEDLVTTRLELLTAAELEVEAAAEGFAAVDRVEIPPTDDHVGSTVLVLEAG